MPYRINRRERLPAGIAASTLIEGLEAIDGVTADAAEINLLDGLTELPSGVSPELEAIAFIGAAAIANVAEPAPFYGHADSGAALGVTYDQAAMQAIMGNHADRLNVILDLLAAYGLTDAS